MTGVVTAPHGIGREQRRQALRLLKAIARGSARFDGLAEDGSQRLCCQPSGRIVTVDKGLVAALISADAVGQQADEALILTQAGLAWLRRALSEGDPFRAQHQIRGLETRLMDDSTPNTVTIDLTESPLAWLARRKRTDGRPWLSTAQLAAGERLREDFTRGGMMARVTADWSGAVHGGLRRTGSAGGVADLTDAALAARTRVRAALESAGAGLSGVLIDVCCFLKGLETVEKQHGWPMRSGKVILAIALDGLAAHYGFSDEATGPNRRVRARAYPG